MEENKKPEKIIVAYREQKKTHKKGFTIFIALSIVVFLVMASICFTRNDISLMNLGGILCILAGVYALLFFVVKNRSKIIEKVNGLSVLIGVCVFKALKKLGVNNLTIKWPNDVYIGEKKVCGLRDRLRAPRLER